MTNTKMPRIAAIVDTALKRIDSSALTKKTLAFQDTQGTSFPPTYQNCHKQKKKSYNLLRRKG